MTRIFERSQLNLPKKFAALLVLLVSIPLLIIAFNRTRTSLNHLSVTNAVSKIYNKEELEADDLDRLIETAQSSLEVIENPHYWDDLSQLELYKWQNNVDLSEEDKLQLLKKTRQHIEQSLARSPANSERWFKLAGLLLFLDEPTEKATKTLMMSILTGPNEGGILLPRLTLGLALMPNYSIEDRDILSEQILKAWSFAPKQFIENVAIAPEQMDSVYDLLEGKQDWILKEMEEAIEKTD